MSQDRCFPFMREAPVFSFSEEAGQGRLKKGPASVMPGAPLGRQRRLRSAARKPAGTLRRGCIAGHKAVGPTFWSGIACGRKGAVLSYFSAAFFPCMPERRGRGLSRPCGGMRKNCGRGGVFCLWYDNGLAVLDFGAELAGISRSLPFGGREQETPASQSMFTGSRSREILSSWGSVPRSRSASA